MATEKRRVSGTAVGGGMPPDGGVPESAAVRRPKKTRKRRSGKKRKKKRQSFTPEERREAVEAYLQTDLTKKSFSKLWGISDATLGKWLHKYQTEGPKGLERKPHGGKGKMRIAKAVREEIVRTKRFFPDFGLKRVRDYLFRFRSVKVSEGSIGKALKDADLPPAPVPKKKRRRKKKVRRFERSRPGELWQSDITSYVLTRHGARAYLTVFLDDFSRYVVSFALALHQKQDLVMEALLSGLDRFGKPKEVLTDQGRQYYSWRGKSFFQKYIEKQGIRHVVARSHHPQTLGKCERLWKTVQEEYWSRAQPQGVAEAREGLCHFFAHYNHTRPHQGIGGLVPADRFFDAESGVRKALEEQHEENELRLALGEKPRRGVYLVGQIGGQAVSMHGERGRLVIQGPDGEEKRIDTKELGMPQEERDGRRNDRREERGESKQATSWPSEAQGELQAPETSRGGGEGPLGCGERRGEGDGSPDGSGDPGDVAGAGESQGGGGASRGAAASSVAAVAAGTVWDGGGAASPAEGPSADARNDAGGSTLEAAEENGENGDGAREPETACGPLEGTARPPAPGEAKEEDAARGAERCQGVCLPKRNEKSDETWSNKRRE